MISLLAIAVSGALTIQRALSARSLVYFLVAGFSAYIGEWLGFYKWGCSIDPIGRSWLPYSFGLVAVIIALCEVLGTWLLRGVMLRLPIQVRWFMLFMCCAYGPALLLATPSLVQTNLNREKGLAIKRLTRIEAAFQRAALDGKSCDPAAAKQSYAVTGFSEPDWEQITVRYVEADGFVFMVHCADYSRGVLVDMHRRRTGTDARCIDSDMKLGCQLQNLGANQGYGCATCPPSQ